MNNLGIEFPNNVPGPYSISDVDSHKFIGFHESFVYLMERISHALIERVSVMSKKADFQFYFLMEKPMIRRDFVPMKTRENKKRGIMYKHFKPKFPVRNFT